MKKSMLLVVNTKVGTATLHTPGEFDEPLIVISHLVEDQSDNPPTQWEPLMLSVEVAKSLVSLLSNAIASIELAKIPPPPDTPRH